MWHEGYTSEINYTSGYYAELAPARIKLALLACGIDHSVPDDPAYLELGFGQGLSLNIHAATNSGRYFGTDFNPGQVANARDLAGFMDKQMVLLEDSFEQLAARSDLPQFDIIALHGIWSWVSEGSRKAIVDILLNRLKPGGVVYISYNVTPGWSPAAPLRTLLSEYGRRAGTGPILDRVEQSIDFVDKVIGANANYFVRNPALKARLDQIRGQDRTYIAHEYFNMHWDPMPFFQVADCLAEAKLTHAGSATMFDNLPNIGTTPEARKVLEEIRDPVLRETTRDYFVEQQFRRDIFVKGPRQIAPYDRARRVDSTCFTLLGVPENRPTKISTPIGEASLRDAVYKPLVEALAAAPGGKATVAELVDMKATGSLTRPQVWEALLVLTGAGFVAPVNRSATPEEDRAASAAINAELIERAEASVGMNYLASPVLGTGIAVTRIEQLFIRAMQKGEKDPAAFVWAVLAAQGKRLILDGKAIESEVDNIKELRAQLATFKAERHDMLKRLEVF